MGRKRKLSPTVSEHRGRVRARWTSGSGRQEIDLGPADQPEVWRANLARLTERLATEPDSAPRLPSDLLVSELLVAWIGGSDLAHVRDRSRYRQAVAQFGDMFGERVAREIKTGEVESWAIGMARLERDGKQVYSESTIRARLAYLKRAWRWAARQGLLPAECSMQFDLVAGPRPGIARKTRKIRSASAEQVELILPHLRSPVRAIVQLQRLTGARPSELFRLRPRDVLRDCVAEIADYGKVDLKRLGVWLVVLEEHKTESVSACDRWIVLGRQAQEILAPFLERANDAFCFSPVEAAEERWQESREDRAKRGGGSGGNRKPKAESRLRQHYDKGSYRQAVNRACVKAGVPKINPYQLRHLFSVTTRDAHGLDATQAAMGHTSPQTTQRYAKRSFDLAARVARESG